MHGHADAPAPPYVDYNAKSAAAAAAATPHQDVPGDIKREKPIVRAHAYEVTFLNAQPTLQVMPDKPAEGYSNYFLGNDPSKWKSGVKSYQQILYKDLYNGIDMQVYSEASLLKYDLVVHPGADPSNIQLQYSGVDRLELKKEQLEITTSVGTSTEQMPYAYQYINNQRVPVKVSYRVTAIK
jgi:hypothetical protein